MSKFETILRHFDLSTRNRKSVKKAQRSIENGNRKKKTSKTHAGVQAAQGYP